MWEKFKIIVGIVGIIIVVISLILLLTGINENLVLPVCVFSKVLIHVLNVVENKFKL